MQTVSLEVANLIAGLGVKPKYETEQTTEVGVSLPNFQELLDILPQIGEKLGWEQEFIDKKFATNFEKVAVYVAHRLLDLYLTGGMEAVSTELLKLLGKK